MKPYARHLPEILVATAVAIGCSSAFAQSLAMTYNLNGQDAQRGGAPSCTSFPRAASCAQTEPLPRFSREAPQKTTVAVPARPAEPSLIPYLGEAATRSAETRTPSADSGQPDFKFHLGSRARAGRSEDELERRLRNAAYESRTSRSGFNAVGLELVVPIRTRVLNSPDPAPPE